MSSRAVWLLVLVFLLDLIPFHHLIPVRQRILKNTNLINSELKAQEILQRYGYLHCRIMRRRRYFKVVFHGGRPQRDCTVEDIREAVRRYQHRYHLKVTGQFDLDTLQLLSKSRCGNPDDEDRALPLYRSSHDGPKARPKRSVSESSVPIESVVGPSMSHRVQWVKDYIQQITSGDLEKRLQTMYDVIAERKRRKRSAKTKTPAEIFSQEVITWRLISNGYSSQLTVNTQRAVLGLAFRMWSEVIPRIFIEDTKSNVDDVDILIAFGKGEHMNCPNDFDGYGGQLSHAIRLDGAAEIHVDDDEYFTMGSEQGTNLLKVGVHEVGHVLGLIHTARNYSIMYDIYSQALPNHNFELNWEDRKLIQSIYGICQGRFDTIFDWIRRRSDGQLIYNTYFFRGDRYWMYENRYNRTRYGDPLAIVPEWKGIPSNVDGFAHIWTYNTDAAYFFKGHQYWRYDNVKDCVADGYPRNISQDFGPVSNSHFPSIPDNIDSVVFDKRDGNLYFFKANLVYAYNISEGREGCCLPNYPKEFRLEFPTASGSKPLNGYIDVSYYSYTDRTMYFFKGTHYWVNSAFNPVSKQRINLLRGPSFAHKKWYDICNAVIMPKNSN